ncbi:hypothetical protein ABFT80_01150 [Mesorhizobium sp. SB112]
MGDVYGEGPAIAEGVIARIQCDIAVKTAHFFANEQAYIDRGNY